MFKLLTISVSMSDLESKSLNQLLQVPSVNPVADDEKRPLWSVVIPTFNRTEYLKQALECVLAQDLGPDKMHIEVIDNCSTESDPETLIKKISQQRISFYRQPKDIGLVGNLTACIQRSRGHLVHILHDDDLVTPGFYMQMQEAFKKEPSIGAAFCRTRFVTAMGRSIKQRKTPGILENWLERIAVENLIQPPSMVVRRSVYEKLGGFNPNLVHACDWEMWTRIAAHYPVWYEPQVLGCSRMHSLSESAGFIRSAENIMDERRAIEIIYAYLPSSKAERLYKKVNSNCTLWNIIGASRIFASGNSTAAWTQVQEALRGQVPSVKVMGMLAALPLRSVGVYLKNMIDYS
jgi:glycosyltransferase involved in cell wall biosynthesis